MRASEASAHNRCRTASPKRGPTTRLRRGVTRVIERQLTLAKPEGHRGDWFAKWKGENLPCVHEVYYVNRKGEKPYYEDTGVGGNPRWRPFIAAIKSLKRVVLTSDHLGDHNVPTDRKAYVAIYRVDNVVHEGSVLTFDFVERLPDRST